MTEKIRLQRYLASAGVAARRKAEELIVAGHVRVNGKQVRLLGTKVDPVRDQVTVGGEAVHPRDNFYVLLNKPKGCVTAVEDDRGRPTVMEYLPNLPIPVRPVGRLDFYAEGVVLLTNDGDLSARLVSGQRHIPKTYHVKVRGELRREHLEALRNGVRLEDGTTTLPAEVNFLPGESRHAWVGVTVIENKQHQVQRMMEALGYQVQKLQCVAFATLTFHGLRVGDARELTQLELNTLRDLVDLDHSAAARGSWRTYREDTDIPRRAREKARAEAAEAGADSDAPPPAAWRDADDERPARRDDRSSPRAARDDRSSPRAAREDRAPRKPAARDGRAPRRPEDRAPRKAPSRDARGPASRDARPAAPEDRAPRRPEDRAPRRPEDRAPRRPEDRAPRRPEDRAPRRAPSRDARGPTSRDARPARRDDDRAPRRPDDRAPRRTAASPSGAPSGRPPARGERSAPSFDTAARPASRGTSFGARAPSSRPTPRGASFGPPDRPSRGPRPGQSPSARPSRPASRPSKPRRK